MAHFINNTLHPLPGSYMQNCTANNTGFMSCIADYVNVVTEGAFWVIMLLGFGIVMFMATFTKYGPKKAFGFISFIWIMGGILFATLELMTWWIASAFIVAGLVGLGVMIFRE